MKGVLKLFSQMEVGRAQRNRRIFEARCIPLLFLQQQGSNRGQFILMVEKRGEGRGSILQGSSVHNQRLERLWRDMRKMATEYF